MLPSDTNPRAVPTTLSKCNSTKGGWQLSGSVSCAIITRSSNLTEVGHPLLYSIFENKTHSYTMNQEKEKKKKRHNHQDPSRQGARQVSWQGYLLLPEILLSLPPVRLDI